MSAALALVWAWLLNPPGRDYHDYLDSLGWRVTKLLRKRDKCQRCETRTRLQLHHKEYKWHNKNPRIRMFVPNLFDRMETLCDTHHGKEHGK